MITRPTIPAARYGERLSAVRDHARDAGFDALLVGVGADMRYLAGYPGRDIAYIRDNDAPNRPPTVAIVSPPDGSVFSAPLDLRLVAAAGDSDG